jgi:hypothetical protein
MKASWMVSAGPRQRSELTERTGSQKLASLRGRSVAAVAAATILATSSAVAADASTTGTQRSAARAAIPASAAPTGEMRAAKTARPASCGNFAARTAYVTDPFGNRGLIQVSYSSCTRNVWAYLLSYMSPCHVVPGDSANGCGYGVIHRNSDGAERSCGISEGQTSCNSDQLNDANVTSYAYGEIDDGPYNALGSTSNW